MGFIKSDQIYICCRFYKHEPGPVVLGIASPIRKIKFRPLPSSSKDKGNRVMADRIIPGFRGNGRIVRLPHFGPRKVAFYRRLRVVGKDGHLVESSQPGRQALHFSLVGGLSAEARDLLSRHRPDTIAQANRLPGMTPAAVLAVLRYLKSRKTGIDGKTAVTGG